jgi:probable F420-dependent oxidoreductase
MEFGVSVPADPPTVGQVAKLTLAEANGFTNGWVWDSHILMQEYSPLMTLAAVGTRTMVIGSCVTNPVTRDPTVTASFFATLANMVGGERVCCGIGRGDSAVRIRSARPANLAALEETIRIVRALVRGEETDVEGHPVRLEWAKGGDVKILVAAYGPKALRLAGRVGDGVILQIADPFFIEWCLTHVREGAEEAERDWSTFHVQAAAPGFVSDDRSEAHSNLRWFPALVGNHIADMLRHHPPEEIPEDLRKYVEARTQYDYRRHTRQDTQHSHYVPHEIIDRFTVLGSAEECVDKIKHLESIGVTEFNLYSAVSKPEELIRTYGREILPAFQ